MMSDTIKLAKPYDNRSWWFKKTLTYNVFNTFHQYMNYSWYLDDGHMDDGMSDSTRIFATVYDDKPDIVYIEVDDSLRLSVRTLHCPEVEAIFVTYVAGEHTTQKINIDTVRFDSSLRGKGKHGLYATDVEWVIEDAIKGLYGEHVKVSLMNVRLLKRLKKQYSQTLKKQLCNALPALLKQLHNTDIYEISRHMCPSWFYHTG